MPDGGPSMPDGGPFMPSGGSEKDRICLGSPPCSPRNISCQLRCIPDGGTSIPDGGKSKSSGGAPIPSGMDGLVLRFACSAFFMMLRSESGKVQNIKVVALETSFPTSLRTASSEICSLSYARNTEQHFGDAFVPSGFALYLVYL